MKINDIDKFGNCVSCHRQLVRNVVVGGKVQGILDSDASDSFFRLNTGSILVVPICKSCKKNIKLSDPETHDKILAEVMNGWELEIHHMKRNPEHFKDFTPEKEKALRDMYSGLKIVKHERNHKVGVK